MRFAGNDSLHQRDGMGQSRSLLTWVPQPGATGLGDVGRTKVGRTQYLDVIKAYTSSVNAAAL